MKYATDHAFRTALEARIKDAQSDSAGISRIRKRILFERLLARLVEQAPREWVLKGGFALELRLGTGRKSTGCAAQSGGDPPESSAGAAQARGPEHTLGVQFGVQI